MAPKDFDDAREAMVRTQIEARGIRDGAVLAAMRAVPREAFLPAGLGEFAYADHPLPIGAEQTISQPYIVALMTEALGLRGGERVLEIGAGSGYAAAVLGRIAAEVYTVERHGELAEAARARLGALGFDNVHVLHGDGTLGWPEHAPYDAIIVAAGGPEVPRALVEQLKPGGRLVIPVGEDRSLQHLTRLTRERDGSLRREDLGGVRFVPLVGAQGWREEEDLRGPEGRRGSSPETVARLLREVAEPFTGKPAEVDVGALVERIGDARVVLIGEASHGTSEFYALRAHITKALIRSHGFDVVAAEADWPDAGRIHRYAQQMPAAAFPEWRAFARFPFWMWRNREVLEFVEWLREWNVREAKVGFYGLDLYSLYRSLRLVLEYLDRVDPESARIARERYARLTPWEGDPATYGRAAVTGRYRACEAEVVAVLRDLLARELDYAAQDGAHFLDAAGNARVVANAEHYYRAMYYGGNESWNLRDEHMFATLESLLRHHGPHSKAIVWAHNSHLGDARATEMGARGQLNLGQLCRNAFGDRAYLIGFGTDHGHVAAAHEWDGPMSVMSVRPSHPQSYERLCHESSVPAFFLPLRAPRRDTVRQELAAPRLERAIGVIYRPETEVQSHYFHAVLPRQFDEYVWVDETSAVHAIDDRSAQSLPRSHPFAPYGPA